MMRHKVTYHVLLFIHLFSWQKQASIADTIPQSGTVMSSHWGGAKADVPFRFTAVYRVTEFLN